VLLVSAWPWPVFAQPTTIAQLPLKQLSIEELLEVDVSLPLRRDERVMDAPAAISVLTSEDLRRSGAVTLPEALRFVPGLFVARFNASAWIVTARGFANNAANKMLVMIDGRTVYSPLFSGVFWEQQDTSLLDVDRVEVIRGPGAALWGANAVNGVINVVSKPASATQGTLVTVGGGLEEHFNGTVRYGGRAGAGHYRVYGKYFDRDAAHTSLGEDAQDWQRFGQGGVRTDFGEPGRQLTLQADTYVTRTGLFDRDNVEAHGANVLARWTRRQSIDSEWQIQTYYDHTSRSVPLQFEEQRGTFDVDVQHHWTADPSHEVSWGAGYRVSADDTTATPVLFFEPEDRTTDLLSAFVQDQIAWGRRLSTIVGAKIEHNDYTGVELQPTARIRWTPSSSHAAWGAVSRAVRMPTRLDTDVRIRGASGAVLIRGNPDFESETLVAYEGGYRASPRRGVAFDVVMFRQHFGDLRTQEPVPGQPVLVGNGLNAVTTGVTASASVQPRSWARVAGAYAYLTHDLSLDPTSRDLGRGLLETIDPSHQGMFSARLDLPKQFELDVSTRHISSLPNPGTPGYHEATVRLGWRPSTRVELAVIARDLLHDDHLEFVSPTSARRTRLERALFTRAILAF
jgi:iron complex outermembrane receptor protein